MEVGGQILRTMCEIDVEMVMPSFVVLRAAIFLLLPNEKPPRGPIFTPPPPRRCARQGSMARQGSHGSKVIMFSILRFFQSFLRNKVPPSVKMPPLSLSRLPPLRPSAIPLLRSPALSIRSCATPRLRTAPGRSRPLPEQESR